MSRRVLRKLQSASKHSTDLDHQGFSESDDTDLSPTEKPGGLRKTSATNPYEVLERERTPSDNEAKEDDDLDADDMDNDQTTTKDSDKVQATDSLKRKKKKKKKKTKEPKEEDVEAVAQEVKELLGEIDVEVPAACSSTSVPIRKLLAIDYRHLLPENEMRRIFGSRVVQADMSKRRVRGRGHTRSTKLVAPHHNWPHVGKCGISMKLLETKNGFHYFKFEHNTHYQQIQFQFLDAVESLNPDNIVAVINVCPYHVDALLQLSDIMHLGEDMQMAVELIERALYCFESNFHSLFNIAQGNCRLDYKYDENRSFYIALFKHMTYVGQKGCYRTALEFCKVILSIDDPDSDPLGVALMIDYYALKAGEYAYLIQFFEELGAERNLFQLPNFAFSVPLAKFHLSQMKGEDVKVKNEADAELQTALLAFPGLLLLMLEKCNIQPDSRVSGHSFFGLISKDSDPTPLLTLYQLYIGRCSHLWKEPEVLSWLEANVNLTLDRVDKKDPLVEHFAEKRKTRYQGMPRIVYRHIMISGIKDATATLPPEMSRTSMLSFDPLPPTDSVSSYERPLRPRQETNQNVLHALFRSLFPNFAVEDAQNPHPIDQNQIAPGLQQAAANAVDAAVAAAAAPNDGGDNSDPHDFRRSVTSLLDAMRDLLTNIHFPEVEQDGDADDSDEDPEN